MKDDDLKLTEAEKVIYERDYALPAINNSLKTGFANRAKVLELTPLVYSLFEGSPKPPTYIWGPFRNPLEAAYAEKLLMDGYYQELVDNKVPMSEELNDAFIKRVENYFENNKTDEETSKILAEHLKNRYFNNKNKRGDFSTRNQVFSVMDASWISFHKFFAEVRKDPEAIKYLPIVEFSNYTGWWAPFNDNLIFQHFPEEIHFENDVPHCVNGPAIKFFGSNGFDVWAYKGLIVDKNIILKKFSWQDIDAEKNAKIRRVMVDLYGAENYIRDSGTKCVHEDDFGKLYRRVQNEDEDLVMVEVINSTPEPDGTYKNYFLRCDPNAYGGLKTAQAAVASTWRNEDGSLVFKNPLDYDPVIET